MADLGGRRRARTAEQKQQRRELILDTAWRLFQDRPYDAITMALVAEQTALAKGTLYLYVRTKEELFLAVLQCQLGLWLDAIDAQAAVGSWTAEQAAGLLCHSLVERPAFVRLLGMLWPIIEPNVDIAAIVGFKQMLITRLTNTGALLEARLPFLAPGQGPRLLLRLYALVIGLQQLATPPKQAAHLLEAPEMQTLAIDFAQELVETTAALLRGLVRQDPPDQGATRE